MSEPLKPRIDFDGPLQSGENSAAERRSRIRHHGGGQLRASAAGDRRRGRGAAEAVVESVLRPKRSLWRRMVSAGLAIFGVSVVAQGVQWTANARQTGTGLRWAAASPGR